MKRSGAKGRHGAEFSVACAYVFLLLQSLFPAAQVNYYEGGGKYGPHYDSDRHPHMYREKVMTVVFCLDTVQEENGGALTFPKAPLKIRPEAGLAIVYHNTIEDGNLDMSSLHADEELLGGSKWSAILHIHATPVPLAARTIIPAIIMMSGGDTPLWMSRYREWAMERFGVDRGYEVFNYSFLGMTSLFLLPFIMLVVLVMKQAQAPVAVPKSKSS